jgi:hypothetical protein
MALPTSGPISISDFNVALGRAADTPNSALAGGDPPAPGSLLYIAAEQGVINQTAPFGFDDWYGFDPTTTTTTTTAAPTTTTTTTTAAPAIIFVNSSSSTSTSITLPAGLQANDVVIICSMSDDNNQNLPSGYTNGQNGNTNSVGYRWSYKRMGATPDTTATGLSSGSVHIAFAFRNVNATTILDASSPVIATGGSGMPNSPSITTVTNGAMVVAMGFLDDDQTTATAPTNFSLARSANYSNGTVMAAYRLKSPAGAEDPGAFGGGGTDSWIGATTALRPL